MPPPAELRKRLEKQRIAANAADGIKKQSLSRSRIVLLLSILGVSILAIILVAYRIIRKPFELDPPEEIKNSEALQLLDHANNAIRRKYNYTMALEYIESALRIEPASTGIRHFYASVLLALDRVQDAYAYFHDIFNSRAALTADPRFLQEYILTLHRLEKQEELHAAWPRVVATPGVVWRTPLQCPDKVEEAFLDGAVPFPDPSESRVTQLMMENSATIVKEFNEFRKQPGWSTFFKPNQDNDLVQGNGQLQWTEMLLFDKGAWDPRYCAIFPTVCKKFAGLRDIEGIFNGKRSGQVSLLKLEAGTTLVPHFGSVNWRYTAHLGLLVPDNVTMTAGGESRQYVQGEVLLLDDSFLHSVRHEGKGPRVTFFVNFFHPLAKPFTPEEWYANS